MDNNTEKDYVLLKGNEAIAKAAIRYGYDGFFGYPITPQSEVLETLAADKPWETTGMVVLQAESEVASINMLYGAGCTGKLAFTSSSSPGIALMQEGISYMAGNELPGVIVSVGRGGPGLGTIQPGQADYFQAVYGGGNGDYNLIVLAPNSVQEMCDCMGKAAKLTFKWRTPVIILSDGVIGQMMEKVELPPFTPRRTNEEIGKLYPWATNGIGLKNRKYNVMSTLEFDPQVMEDRNHAMTEKYRRIEAEEVDYELYKTDDAEFLIIAYGISSRVSMKTIDILRSTGVKVGMLRPKTLWPFPNKAISKLSEQMKSILCVEQSEGQLIKDVRLAVEGQVPVYHFGRCGGIIATPVEVLEAFKSMAKESITRNWPKGYWMK
ncbi:MAG: 3-methyl-2-oxobutanoate dehydrogenase subunit VorB [Bacteroidaceae bacterium]|nr:3-methyl-2-oxobutanoate dehydrogenase subunit VorB [Bacteroidaceae bacterium]